MPGKLKKGKKFDLEDFKDQIQQMNNMGGIASMLDKMPGMGKVSQAAQGKINDKSFIQMEAIINSMTPGERHYPDSINGSRKKRDCRRVRDADPGHQPIAEAAQTDAEDDEEAGQKRRDEQHDARYGRHDAATGWRIPG